MHHLQVFFFLVPQEIFINFYYLTFILSSRVHVQVYYTGKWHVLGVWCIDYLQIFKKILLIAALFTIPQATIIFFYELPVFPKYQNIFGYQTQPL